MGRPMDPYLLDCPRCHQGAVYLEEIIATAEIITVCEECLAVWVPPNEPNNVEWTDLTTMLLRRQLVPPNWTQLRDV